jgi:putative addiction module component (TIGR02574 family)
MHVRLESSKGDVMNAIDIYDMHVAEKLQLTEALWDSLSAHGAETLESPAWHQKILAERLQRFNRGEDTVSPWPKAKERIRTQIKAG